MIEFKCFPSCKAVLVSSVVSAAALISGPLATTAHASDFGTAVKPSLWNMWSHGTHANKLQKKAAFASGTSAVYSHSNLLPKTARFVRPIVAASYIFGNARGTCSISGLGHRSSCGYSL